MAHTKPVAKLNMISLYNTQSLVKTLQVGQVTIIFIHRRSHRSAVVNVFGVFLLKATTKPKFRTYYKDKYFVQT